MRQLFGVDPGQDQLGNQQPLSAIFPKHQGPVVRLSENRSRELVSMHWGFLTPQNSKKTGKPIKPAAWNNARDDKLRSAGLWRQSFEARRCLIPGSSFCETKGRNPATSFWFRMTGDEARPPFAFAGLWRDDALAEGPAYTMVTTTANEVVKPIHPSRMPVILDPGTYETWLHGSTDEAQGLLRPYPAAQMEVAFSGEGARTDDGETD